MSQEKTSNTDLIDNLYELAGKELMNKVTDWSNHELWRQSVNELEETLKALSYRHFQSTDNERWIYPIF
ncbi:hypothetical protein [Reichenbachiella sp. MALMAid0571]|uniref:hypothetical protein n=1 Tax=Reichenbachiella sp. MALMAid0571 TaxID=3143939 RepID=UPI0032DFB90A